MSSLVSFRNVSLSYEGRTVLSGLTFDINRGDFISIVGENGSGKSTLVKALLSLKHIDGGEIILGDGLKRSEIGYLPQQWSGRGSFPASVWEVVLSGRLNSVKSRAFPFYTKEDRADAEKKIDMMGISEYKKHAFCELSGGQMQRVLLARALCATKSLLVLDEPVTGLDPLVSADFYELIKKINDDGITVLTVSHDIPSAVKYSSKILHIHTTPLFFGSAADYAASDAGRRFLGGDGNA